jgi:hypothetical protein
VGADKNPSFIYVEGRGREPMKARTCGYLRRVYFAQMLFSS